MRSQILLQANPTPAPVPGPFGLSPEWATALATGVIAVFTIVSAVALIRTLFHNRQMVEAAARQAEIQWQAAVPRLQPGQLGPERPGPPNPHSIRIEYRAGTLPARDIDVWLMYRSVLYYGHQDMLTASDAGMLCTVNPVVSQPGATSPFPDMTNQTGLNEWWVGLLWRDPLHQRYRSSSEMAFGSYRLLSQEAIGPRSIAEMRIHVTWHPELDPAVKCERCWFWSRVAATISRSDRVGSIPVCLKHAEAFEKGDARMRKFVMKRLP